MVYESQIPAQFNFFGERAEPAYHTWPDLTPLTKSIHLGSDIATIGTTTISGDSSIDNDNNYDDRCDINDNINKEIM